MLEPLDLMARLAALVPPPRMHLTRFHGVFAPHSKLRAAVTPAHRGVGAPKPPIRPGDAEQPAAPRHVAMNWARRLKRVFGVEIEACARCGGRLKIIARIEEPQVIAKMLSHMQKVAPDGRHQEATAAGQGHHEIGGGRPGEGREAADERMFALGAWIAWGPGAAVTVRRPPDDGAAWGSIYLAPGAPGPLPCSVARTTSAAALPNSVASLLTITSW